MIELLQSGEVQHFIRSHEHEDVHNLALKLNKPVNGVPIAELANQIKCLQTARKKLPEWYEKKGIIWPPYLSMEQCSSEPTAKFKASYVNGRSLVDLTGGTGVDTYYLSQHFKEVHYVEQSKLLCERAEHNFNTLNADIQVHHTTAEDYLEALVESDVIYIDPARRDKGKKKVFQIEDCSPDILQLMPLLKQKAGKILIKLSPLLDIQLLMDKIPEINELLILADRNECKELVAILDPAQHATEVRVTAVNIGQHPFEFNLKDEGVAESAFGHLEQYMYEPNAAIMKSGAFKLVGVRYGLAKLHQHTHLYTASHLVENFPGRVFEVQKQLGFDKKLIRKEIPGNQANISVRNFPLKAPEVYKKLGIKSGGELYLFGFRNFQDQVQVALTTKVSE